MRYLSNVRANHAACAAIIVALLVPAGVGTGSAASPRGRTLIRTERPIWAVAADRHHLAWSERAGRCGSRFVVVDLVSRRKTAVDPCRAPRGWRCCASGPVLAGSTLAWQLWAHRAYAQRFGVLATTLRGSRPRLVGESAFADMEGPSGGPPIPPPVIGADGDLSFLTFCDSPCRSGTGMTLWTLRNGRPKPLRRLYYHLEHQVFAAAEGRAAVQGYKCGCIGSPAWSPDGRRIAYAASPERLHGGPQDVYVMPAGGGRGRRFAKKPIVTGEIDWSSDGRHLILEGAGGWITTLDVRTRKLRRLTRGIDPAWSPNGREFAFSRGGRIFVQQLAARSARSVADGVQPTWSPDGRRLAYDRGGALFVLELKSGSERKLVTPVDPELPWDLQPDWSPDGKWIAFADLTVDDAVQIFVIRPDGSGRRPVASATDVAEAPAWSSSGRLAYVAAEQGRTGRVGGRNIYTLTAGGRSRRITNDPPSRTVLVAIESRTGRTIGFASTGVEDFSAVGVSRRYLVGVGQSTARRLDVFSVRGRPLGAIRLPGVAGSVSVAGRFALVESDRRFYLVDLRRRSVRRIGAAGIADAVLEPNRLIWAENARRSGRILALDLPS